MKNVLCDVQRMSLALVWVTCAMGSGAVRANHLADVYERVKDSVVTVLAVESVVKNDGLSRRQVLSTAAGVLIAPQGLVLTAAHIVQAADEVAVVFRNEKRYQARVIASEPQADVALLKLKTSPPDVYVPKIGNSNELRVGDEIFAVGKKQGLGNFLSAGRVSARHGRVRLTPTLTLAEFFLTDAFIEDDQFGSPVFNEIGAIVGIVSRALAAGESAKTVGLVISAETVKHYLFARRSPWTGVQGSWLEGRTARALNLPHERGLLVEGVAADSLGAALGLLPGTVPTLVEGQLFLAGGDVVLSIQLIPLEDYKAYEGAMERLCESPEGELVTMRVLRDGRELDLAVRYQDHCHSYRLSNPQ